MKFLEEKLAAMDNYFAAKKENEKWLMILGTAGIIAYVAYTSFLPIAQSKFDATESKKEVLQKSIQENKIYLKSISSPSGDKNYKVNLLTKDINKKTKNLSYIKREIKYVDNSLEKLSDMLFNEKSWSTFLHSLTDNAKNDGLMVRYLENNYVESEGDFGHILEISVGVEGNYKNIINFMNDIEQNELVTDIYGSKLSLDENSTKIVADINISVWGINH